jgi:SAM-dependent methyltransferase
MEKTMPNITVNNTIESFSPCILCGPTMVAVLSLKDRHGEYLRTVICTVCGLIWHDPRPDASEMKKFYSEEYRLDYKGLTRPKKKHVYRDAVEAMRRYNFFKELLQPKYTLLDVGAGNGVFVCCLRELGINASGIGPCENHSQYARDVLKTPVRTGFSQDTNEDESYNFITLHHVLEHMADPLTELKHLRRILADDGYLIVEVPNAENIKQDPGNRYHKAHIFTFNPETLTALGRETGFTPHHQTTEPLNGNISIIFRKQIEESPPPVELRDNMKKITTTLNNHTSFRHFTSPIPYTKLAENILTAIREQRAIRKCRTDLDIINSVISSAAR